MGPNSFAQMICINSPKRYVVLNYLQKLKPPDQCVLSSFAGDWSCLVIQKRHVVSKLTLENIIILLLLLIIIRAWIL